MFENLNSIVLVRVDDEKYEFQGLSSDVDKLPLDNVRNGSFCLMLDTSEVYIYHKPSNKWYLI